MDAAAHASGQSATKEKEEGEEAEEHECTACDGPVMELRLLEEYTALRGSGLGGQEGGMLAAQARVSWCILHANAREGGVASWAKTLGADAALARHCMGQFEALRSAGKGDLAGLQAKALRCRRLLVQCLLEDGRLDEAEREGEESERAHEEALGPDDRCTLRARHLRDCAVFHLGRHREAAERARRTFARQRECLGSRDRHALESAVLLVSALASSGGSDEERARVVQHGKHYWSLCCKTLGPESRTSTLAWQGYAEAMLARGDVEGVVRGIALLERRMPGNIAFDNRVGAFHILAAFLAGPVKNQPIPVVAGGLPRARLSGGVKDWDPFVTAVVALLHSYAEDCRACEDDSCSLRLARVATAKARQTRAKDRHMLLPFALAAECEVLWRSGLVSDAKDAGEEALALMVEGTQGHWYTWRLEEVLGCVRSGTPAPAVGHKREPAGEEASVVRRQSEGESEEDPPAKRPCHQGEERGMNPEEN